MNFSNLSKVSMGDQKADLVFKNGKILDVFTNQIYEATLAVKDGYIVGIGDYEGNETIDLEGKTLVPGLMDAHLHLESTCVKPSELIATASLAGTTTFVVDPHEAANVSGAVGIQYILDQTENSTANVYVMMPSCVPATYLDDNGCTFDAKDMEKFLDNDRILGLGEVMDAFSVVHDVKDMHDKLNLFKDKVIDGHAPFLTEKQLNTYALAGIATDHEATSFEWAVEEMRRGIHVHIREGSAAHNLTDIVSGIIKNKISTENFSFCTDDKHIADIHANGHISNNVRMAIQLGLDPVEAIKMASINTAKCYGLKELGALAPGYQADILIVDNINDFNIEKVYFKGKLVEKDNIPACKPCPYELLHTVFKDPVSQDDFKLAIDGLSHVIELNKGQITTNDLELELEKCANFESGNGLVKVAAIERHKNTQMIGIGLAKGYDIVKGAVASSVSHDSHNIIVIGDNDRDIAMAVNEIIRVQGGYTLVDDGKIYETLPLPVMGLMSEECHEVVQSKLDYMIKRVHEKGVSRDIAPFVTLSFMALPVIPELRITPRGLVKCDDKGFRLI